MPDNEIVGGEGPQEHPIVNLPQWWNSDKPYKIVDCILGLENLPDNSIDCFILDPPYSTGARDGTRRVRGSMQRTDTRGWFLFDNMTTRGFTFFLRTICLMALYKAKEGAFIHIFCDWRQYPNVADVMESAGLILQNCIVWDKKSFGLGMNYRNQHEFIAVATKGKQRETLHDVGNVISINRRKSPEHPTEKPSKLIEKLILASTSKGDIVIDPFLGSGATLEACRKTDRIGLGFEINPDYELMISNRVNCKIPRIESFPNKVKYQGETTDA